MNATSDVKDHREIGETDIYRAAHALTRHNRLIRVDDSRPWQVVFIFDATARLDLDSFDAGGMVEARLYADSIKHLKGNLARKRRGEEA